MTTSPSVALFALYRQLPTSLQDKLLEFCTKLTNKEPLPEIAFLFGETIHKITIQKHTLDEHTKQTVRNMLLICAAQCVGCVQTLLLPEFNIA
jgi:hypothetical protein